MTEQKETRRGFDPEDCKWFSEKSIEILRTAQQEIIWLLDKGYKLSPIIEFVGGHYQLSSRQRLALQRACCASKQREARQQKIIKQESIKSCFLHIDGFNLIITLEVALSGSVLILGYDGCIRDMAGLRGTYRIIDKTDKAIELIGQSLAALGIHGVRFYLDAPVSNSGRLKTRILELSKSWEFPVEVNLVKNPDSLLSSLENVVTTDSIILDSCQSWINLSRIIIENHISFAQIIDLEGRVF